MRLTSVSTTFMLIALSGSAEAVCLQGQPSVEQEYKESTFVLVGRPIAAVSVAQSKSLLEGTRYTIQVRQALRGEPSRTLSVFSENSSGRFPMKIGTDYLLFLSPRAGESTMVDNCGNSGAVSNSGDAIAIVKRLSRSG